MYSAVKHYVLEQKPEANRLLCLLPCKIQRIDKNSFLLSELVSRKHLTVGNTADKDVNLRNNARSLPF